MEHTKAYKEYKKNGNTKFVRYSEGAEGEQEQSEASIIIRVFRYT